MPNERQHAKIQGSIALLEGVAMNQYSEFRIEIDQAVNGAYPVRMRTSAGAEQRTTISLPLDDPTYQTFMKKVRFRDASLKGDEISKFGKLVYDTLFTNRELWGLYQKASEANKNLRLTLVIDPNAIEAATFPWEFASGDGDIPLANQHSICRFLPRVDSVPPLKASGPLKMLLASAMPADMQETNPLDIEAEFAIVREAVEPLIQKNQLTLIEEPALTARQLRRLIKGEQPHIFHFVGHGVTKQGAGALVLQTEKGERQDLDAVQLAMILQGSLTCLVVLNACNTSVISSDLLQSMAPALLNVNVPAVIAMQSSIQDSAGQTFAEEFYYALAQNEPIDACVAAGRQAIILENRNRIDWGLITLYVRARDGMLFDQGDQPSGSDSSSGSASGNAPTTSANVSFGSGNSFNGSNISVGNVGSTIQQSNQARPASIYSPEEQERTINSLRKLRKTHLSNKDILEGQIAAFAGGAVPIHLINQLNYTNAELERIDKELANLGAR